jgi:hypothetical protein
MGRMVRKVLLRLHDHRAGGAKGPDRSTGKRRTTRRTRAPGRTGDPEGGAGSKVEERVRAHYWGKMGYRGSFIG